MTPQVRSRTIAALLTVASLLLAGCDGNGRLDEEMRDFNRGFEACMRLRNEVERTRGLRAAQKHRERCIDELTGERPKRR